MKHQRTFGFIAFTDAIQEGTTINKVGIKKGTSQILIKKIMAVIQLSDITFSYTIVQKPNRLTPTKV
jgi:hypothetical protein